MRTNGAYGVDSLIFRYQQPPPLPCVWMSISLDRDNLLHLIDAPQDLGHALVQAYDKNVHKYQIKGSVFEIMFRKAVWVPAGTDTVQTRLIFLTLIECLEQQGFSLYASINQDNSDPNGQYRISIADTLFFNQQRDAKIIG